MTTRPKKSTTTSITTSEVPDNFSLYTKRVGDVWEYGIHGVWNAATGNERRAYIKHGEAPTMDEALRLNNMAQKGQSGSNTSPTPYLTR